MGRLRFAVFDPRGGPKFAETAGRQKRPRPSKQTSADPSPPELRSRPDSFKKGDRPTGAAIRVFSNRDFGKAFRIAAAPYFGREAIVTDDPSDYSDPSARLIDAKQFNWIRPLGVIIASGAPTSCSRAR